MTVVEIMSSPTVCVSKDTLAPEIAAIMQKQNIGAVAVVDEQGHLCGLITESDFTGIGRCVPFALSLAPVIFGMRAGTIAEMERIYAMAKTLKAKEFMSENVRTVREQDDVGAVAHLMLTADLKHVPVVRDGKPVGMVARHDLLKLLSPTR